MRRGARVLSVIVVVAAAVAAAYVAGLLLLKEARDARSTPYQYDVGEYRKVPADLVRYAEATRIETEMETPRGIAVGANDDIYVTGDRRVLVLDRGGKERSSFDLDVPAGCIAADRNGAVYLGMRNHVEVYSPSGERSAEWMGLGERAVVTSIAVGADDVFVADYGGRVVWRFDRSGRLRGMVGEGRLIIPSPYFDVAIGPAGALWAANTGRRRMERYGYDGKLEESWGESSMDVEGFCGCCNPSHFAIGSGGSFVTSEKGLERVKVYDSNGKFICVVAGPEDFIEGTVGIDVAVDSAGRVLALDPKTRTVRIYEEKKNE